MTNEIEMSEERLLYEYGSAERAMTGLPGIGEGAARSFTQPVALNGPFECTTKKLFVERDQEAGDLPQLTRRLPTLLPIGS